MRAVHRCVCPRSTRTVLLVLLCISLLLLAVFIQAVHTHPDGAFHANCALCVAAHAAMAIMVSVALLLTLEGFALLFTHQEKPLSCFLIPFELSIRPPPANLLS